MCSDRRRDRIPLAAAAAVAPVIVAAWCAMVLAARPENGTPATPHTALPVMAAVTAEHTYLRSGPGDDFYPTERIAGGERLEVWAVDAAGYCAVRPVRGSFSWLRADEVTTESARPERGGWTGVILTDGAVARVGSQLNDLRHVTQVALEAGERVRVIDEVAIGSGRHAGRWVRIEPPSGEFRWARGEDLDLPPDLAVAVPPPAATDAAGLAAAGPAFDAVREAGTAVRQAVAEMNEATRTPAAEPAPLEPAPGATRLFAGWLPLGTGVFDSSATAPRAVSAGAVAATGDELADLDLALSLAVTGPTESWALAPLRERLRLAAARANAPSDRTRAQAIDARLSRFEAIQRQHGALAAGPPPTDASPLRLGGMWSSLGAVGSRPIRPGVLPGGAAAGGQPTWTPPDQMETTGRLATVISRRPDAPRWALVDGSNNVLAFIAPQAGVNLAPLVGQQVSVRGARGYMPEYKRPYLVASEARPRIAAVPTPSGSAGDRTQ